MLVVAAAFNGFYSFYQQKRAFIHQPVMQFASFMARKCNLFGK